MNFKYVEIVISGFFCTTNASIYFVSCSDCWKQFKICEYIWAAAQQNDWALSEDLDQPAHPLSLIIVFAVRLVDS